MTHGSILGITHDFFNVLAFRPQSRHPSVPGAYFVGASAHPGTGVPIAIAGSRLCTEAVLSDLSIPLPETYGPIKRPVRSSLDIVHSRSIVHLAEDAMLASIPYIIGALMAVSVLFAWASFSGQTMWLDTSSRIAAINSTSGAASPGTHQVEKLLEPFPFYKSIPLEFLPWIALLFITVGAPALLKRML